MPRATRKNPRENRYLTHDNGSRPFAVAVGKGTLTVSKFKDGNYVSPKSFATKQVWIGAPAGNSVLAALTNGTYLFVGDRVYTFRLVRGDEPVKYTSPIGRNDVPYPSLMGKTHTYILMRDKGRVVAIDNSLLTREPVYDQYYMNRSALEAGMTYLPTKMIHDRLFS